MCKIAEKVVAHCPDCPVFRKRKGFVNYSLLLNCGPTVFKKKCHFYSYIVDSVKTGICYLTALVWYEWAWGRSVWVEKAAKLMKIQLKVKNLCTKCFPKPSIEVFAGPIMVPRPYVWHPDLELQLVLWILKESRHSPVCPQTAEQCCSV